MSSALASKSMLVRLSIHAWRGKKSNPKAANTAVTALGATQSSDEFYTHLVPKGAHRALITASAKLRSIHAKYTFPWFDDGLRILPTSTYFQYCQEMREQRDNYDVVADAFCADYNKYKDFAKANRGELYKEEDYPPLDELRRSFWVDISFQPFPVAQDFRIQLDPAELRQIVSDFAAKQTIDLQNGVEKIKAGLQHKIFRVMDMTGHPDNRIAAISLDTLKEGVELSKLLNITDDPTLSAVVSACNSWLTTIDVEALRNDPAVRERAHLACREILEMFNG